MSQWPSDIQALAQSSWVGAPAGPTAIDTTRDPGGGGGPGGYDGIQSRGRRRPPKARTAHEDHLLRQEDRTRLVATTQDVQRNFAVAAWAIRRHLDYVAAFKFICTTGNDDLDTLIEGLIEEASAKEHFDISGRFRRRKFIRMMEARRCVDGDVAAIKLATGHLQAIEGDHLRKPPGMAEGMPTGLKLEEFINGVRVDGTGRILEYMICDRDRKGGPFQFRAVMPAAHVLFHAHHDRFDQSRGISPIAAALNTLCDLYEGIDYTLAKLKLEQLFGLVITSDDEDGVGQHTPVPATTGEEPEGEGEEAESPTGNLYDVNFGRGLFKLELNPGDDAKILTSQNPSTQFQQFIQSMIAISLKSLDIPYSFFDESFTNFYGSRGGLMQYLKACNAKREDIAELLTDWTVWRLTLFILDGRLKLPAGMTLADIKFQWVPDGVAWWDPSKEVVGSCMAIASGLTTFEKVVREIDGGTGDIYRNITDNAAVLKHAREAGFPLTLPGAAAFNTVAANHEDEAARQQRGNE